MSWPFVNLSQLFRDVSASVLLTVVYYLRLNIWYVFVQCEWNFQIINWKSKFWLYGLIWPLITLINWELWWWRRVKANNDIKCWKALFQINEGNLESLNLPWKSAPVTFWGLLAAAESIAPPGAPFFAGGVQQMSAQPGLGKSPRRHMELFSSAVTTNTMNSTH